MPEEITDSVGREIAAKLDEALAKERPVVSLRPPKTQREEAEREDEESKQEAAARKTEHDRLILEALVTKAWQERIRQMRGDVQPEIGPRDIHVKALIIRTLMTITSDNSGFSFGEFEKLA